MMSINVNAQSSCQPTKACKKACSKTAKADKESKAKTDATASLFKFASTTKEAKATKGKDCCKPACCTLPCSKKGAKATTTSVTGVNNEKATTAKEPVAAMKPKSN